MSDQNIGNVWAGVELRTGGVTAGREKARSEVIQLNQEMAREVLKGEQDRERIARTAQQTREAEQLKADRKKVTDAIRAQKDLGAAEKREALQNAQMQTAEMLAELKKSQALQNAEATAGNRAKVAEMRRAYRELLAEAENFERQELAQRRAGRIRMAAEDMEQVKQFERKLTDQEKAQIAYWNKIQRGHIRAIAEDRARDEAATADQAKKDALRTAEAKRTANERLRVQARAAAEERSLARQQMAAQVEDGRRTHDSGFLGAPVMRNEPQLRRQIVEGATTGALGGGAVAALGLGEAVKAASDFQEKMSLVDRQAGATAEQVRHLSKAVLDLAPEVGVGPDKLADGLYHIQSVGVKASEQMDALTNAAKLSRIGLSDMEGTTNGLVGIWAAGFHEINNFTQAAGLMNAAVGSANLRMNDLDAAIGTGLLAKGREAGLTFYSIAGALATLSSQAMGGEEGATRLGMTFALLEKPSKQATDAMKGIGLSQMTLARDMRGPDGLVGMFSDLKKHLDSAHVSETEQARIVLSIFGGGRSGGAAMLLLQNLDMLKQKTQQTADGVKNYGAAWQTTQETAAQQTAKFTAGLQALEIEMGNGLIPEATRLMHGLADMVHSFDKLDQATKDSYMAALEWIGGGLLLFGTLGKMGIFLADAGRAWNELKAAQIAAAVEGSAATEAGAVASETAMTGMGAAAAALGAEVTLSFGTIGLAIGAAALAATAARWAWDEDFGGMATATQNWANRVAENAQRAGNAVANAKAGMAVLNGPDGEPDSGAKIDKKALLADYQGQIDKMVLYSQDVPVDQAKAADLRRKIAATKVEIATETPGTPEYAAATKIHSAASEHALAVAQNDNPDWRQFVKHREGMKLELHDFNDQGKDAAWAAKHPAEAAGFYQRWTSTAEGRAAGAAESAYAPIGGDDHNDPESIKARKKAQREAEKAQRKAEAAQRRADSEARKAERTEDREKSALKADADLGRGAWLETQKLESAGDPAATHVANLAEIEGWKTGQMQKQAGGEEKGLSKDTQAAILAEYHAKVKAENERFSNEQQHKEEADMHAKWQHWQIDNQQYLDYLKTNQQHYTQSQEQYWSNLEKTRQVERQMLGDKLQKGDDVSALFGAEYAKVSKTKNYREQSEGITALGTTAESAFAKVRSKVDGGNASLLQLLGLAKEMEKAFASFGGRGLEEMEKWRQAVKDIEAEMKTAGSFTGHTDPMQTFMARRDDMRASVKTGDVKGMQEAFGRLQEAAGTALEDVKYKWDHQQISTEEYRDTLVRVRAVFKGLGDVGAGEVKTITDAMTELANSTRSAADEAAELYRKANEGALTAHGGSADTLAARLAELSAERDKSQTELSDLQKKLPQEQRDSPENAAALATARAAVDAKYLSDKHRAELDAEQQSRQLTDREVETAKAAGSLSLGAYREYLAERLAAVNSEMAGEKDTGSAAYKMLEEQAHGYAEKFRTANDEILKQQKAMYEPFVSAFEKMGEEGASKFAAKLTKRLGPLGGVLSDLMQGYYKKEMASLIDGGLPGGAGSKRPAGVMAGSAVGLLGSLTSPQGGASATAPLTAALQQNTQSTLSQTVRSWEQIASLGLNTTATGLNTVATQSQGASAGASALGGAVPGLGAAGAAASFSPWGLVAGLGLSMLGGLLGGGGQGQGNPNVVQGIGLGTYHVEAPVTVHVYGNVDSPETADKLARKIGKTTAREAVRAMQARPAGTSAIRNV